MSCVNRSDDTALMPGVYSTPSWGQAGQYALSTIVGDGSSLADVIPLLRVPGPAPGDVMYVAKIAPAREKSYLTQEGPSGGGASCVPAAGQQAAAQHPRLRGRAR